ncbi:hypothetical protein EYF80_042733 [Liparis tanakae]|uniref:Uncharacterized protein n=1 Tax=Liparis tanakae TaxID=230148 RepID=A0A4Z2G0L4_9TELE|nr:hypothetical protein EYF80_042733 [Liparis tanakae]
MKEPHRGAADVLSPFSPQSHINNVSDQRTPEGRRARARPDVGVTFALWSTQLSASSRPLAVSTGTSEVRPLFR